MQNIFFFEDRVGSCKLYFLDILVLLGLSFIVLRLVPFVWMFIAKFSNDVIHNNYVVKAERIGLYFRNNYCARQTTRQFSERN